MATQQQSLINPHAQAPEVKAALAEPETTPATNLIPINPLEALKPMLNEKGEMELASLQLGERMAKFQEFSQKANCNLPLWETNLLTQFPEGTNLLPMPIMPTALDAWRGEDARKMKLKEGQVEPSADFVIKIGNLLGIRLTKIFEGVTEDTGTKMYSCRYNAALTLPNGAVLTVEEEGKDQELFTASGKQAHIIESTRKKAKRNAIKALLGIPTSMPEALFDRPWVLLRPVFHAGISTETDRIIAQQQEQTEQNQKLLYAQKPIDIQAEEVVSVEELTAAIETANTKAELDVVGKRIRTARLTGDERTQLSGKYKARNTLLETGEITQTTTQVEGGQF